MTQHTIWTHPTGATYPVRRIAYFAAPGLLADEQPRRLTIRMLRERALALHHGPVLRIRFDRHQTAERFTANLPPLYTIEVFVVDRWERLP
jgi:hypothetical protein